MSSRSTASQHRTRRPSGEPPPLPREFNRVALAWFFALVVFSALWLWVFLSDQPAIWITRIDLALMRPIAGHRVGWLDPVMEGINKVGTRWATPIVVLTTFAAALLARRIRHAIILLGSLSLVSVVMVLVATQIRRPRPLGFTATGDWEGFAQPSRPVALLATAVVASALTLVPASKRPLCYLSGAITIGVFGLAQLYTAVEHPTDVLAGATAGVAITMGLYRAAAPEAAFPITSRIGKSAHLDVSGERGTALRRGLQRQLGIEAMSVEPIALESSSGSTPLRIETAGGTAYFAKLYAHTHLRADRFYKLYRTLRYGQLEDETRYSSIRRLVQHEDYMLHVMSRHGLDCPEPVGIVEITPHREYLLVTEFVSAATEIGDVDIDEKIIDEALVSIDMLWRAGLAHRDIKPSNIMVQGDRVRLVDVSFAEVRPSPWRQAVDLANMMLVLALRSTPTQVYERARLRFSDDEIAEAFAASTGVTVPLQLRRAIGNDDRDLLAEFRQLVPRRPRVAIQRWSWRRALLLLWFSFLTMLVVSVFLSSLEVIGVY